MVKPRYFNTKEECDKWIKKNWKRLKYGGGVIYDKEQTTPILFPEEIVELYGDHTERFCVHAYRRTQ